MAIEETWDCRAGKLTEEGLSADVRSLRCSMAVRNLALGVLNKDFLISLAKNWKGKDVKYLPQMKHGAVACSASVLAYDGAFDELRRQKRKVYGVEMEAYGCYYAAEQMGERAPQVFALKAVCDLGDKKKNDDLHRFAAYVSAEALKEIICKSALWGLE